MTVPLVCFQGGSKWHQIPQRLVAMVMVVVVDACHTGYAETILDVDAAAHFHCINISNNSWLNVYLFPHGHMSYVSTLLIIVVLRRCVPVWVKKKDIDRTISNV